ncbi:MAG: S-layer homology domain-containing protein [Clostridiales bacterium]|nr:MAG: S-layer homology domain-containing protein [Clostridiales bacterium]
MQTKSELIYRAELPMFTAGSTEISFENFDALGAEFNRIAPEKSTDGGGKGAPSKSTGSSSVTKGGFTGVTPNLPTPVEKEIFGDLNGFDWAKESINALYEKKIVSGKADGVFAPGDSIMREEFVKNHCRGIRF